jgi:hypothetical protein
MRNIFTETSFSDMPWFIATIWQAGRMIALAGFLFLFFGQAYGIENLKEYIYLNGKAIAVDSKPIPISVDMSDPYSDPYSGFAGLETQRITVGNGAGMTIEAVLTLYSWDGLNEYTNNVVIGPLDANGQFSGPIPQEAIPGTYVITAIRNVAGGDLVYLYPPPYYTVRPPKPWNATAYFPSTLQLPAPAGAYWFHSANMRSQTIAFIALISIPPSYQSESEYELPLSNGFDPDYGDKGGNWYHGAMPCELYYWLPSQTRSFYAARNAWDPYGDPEDLESWDNAWIAWEYIVPSEEYMEQTILACQ